jgi:glyoxylase-like metal-dependent hydrolase (beta-lactamase superfamily II)
VTILIPLVITLAGCGSAQSGPTPIPASASPTPTQVAAPLADEDESAPVAGEPGSYERFDISEDLHVRKVQEGVFVITHAFPWPGNSMIVEMTPSDLVLVDTPYTPEATRDVLAWVEAQLGEREITAINTGYHYDNLGGNSTLIAQGIPVYGSELTAELLEERGEEVRAMTLDWLQAPQYQRYREAHESLPYIAPTHLFDLHEGLQLEFGDEIVQVYYPGPSHAADNVVVYFPGRKILFGGCMIIGWDSVGNTSDADLDTWPDSVRNLSQFDFDLLVPGHGDRLDPGLLEHTIDLLTAFRE